MTRAPGVLAPTLAPAPKPKKPCMACNAAPYDYCGGISCSRAPHEVAPED